MFSEMLLDKILNKAENHRYDICPAVINLEIINAQVIVVIA
jgi:hypothetical protein